MKHTPGPWKIVDNRPNNALDKEAAYAIEGTTGMKWAVAAAWKDAGDEDEAEANARLIAAAPDLYAALEDLLKRDERNTCLHDETYRGGAIWEICARCGAKWADDEGGRPEWEDPPEWVKARAALAKVEK